MVTSAAVVGSVRTKILIAQLIAPQRPVYEITKGGLVRPLPG